MSPEPELRRRWTRRAPGVGALLAILLLSGCERQADEVPAAEPRAPVEIRAAVDRAVATTGDLITFRVTVDYDPDWEVSIPEPGTEIAGFRIVDIGREEPRQDNGRVVESSYYQLRADLVGSYVLPPVTVSYRPLPAPDSLADDASGSWSEASTSEIFVEVESVLPLDGQAEDIRGLKPLRDVRHRLPWLWIALGSLLGIAILLAAGWWLRRWRQRAAWTPPRPAHEVAFEELARLRATDFDDPEAVRRFYFRISETIRSYVEGRYAFNATDLTTEEILQWLARGGGPEEAQSAELGIFLRETDAVKFAHLEPSNDDVERTYERALGFVEATREPDEVLEEAA